MNAMRTSMRNGGLATRAAGRGRWPAGQRLVACGALLAGLSLATAATAATAQGAAAADAPIEGPTLVATFHLAPGLGWTTVRLDVGVVAWRVGSAAGPLASDEQLRAVLAQLQSVEVGARCTGWVEGATSYPCGFDVEARRPGAPAFGARRYGLETSAEGRTRTAGRATPQMQAAGLIAPLPDAEAFVGVRVPAGLIGMVSGTASGTAIDLRVRPLSNPLVPSSFDRASGAVLLRGARVAGGGA